jgi:oxygen-independent coproporphyrinogen-3 oxidase
MVDAIVQEITLSPALQQEKAEAGASMNNPEEIISTLYFGGGTPSILQIDELKKIFEALHKRFVFSNDIEITLEANPDDITGHKLQDWKAMGINRLSVGIQSFSDEELIWMNRAHTAAESVICIDLIQASGFTNYSVDLIYGSPVLTDEDWMRNVDLVIEKNIPHISGYALTVEPKTALDKMIALNKKENTDPEKQARQFLSFMNRMEAAGYEHYEISNFARQGYRSRHNSSYWSGEKYFGFGPAAHAFNGRSRSWNISNNSAYIQSLQKGIIPFEEEILTVTQQLNEYIMTSLRTMEGLNLDHISSTFGIDKTKRIMATAGKYESSGKLITVSRNLVLTKEGKLFADGIAADLFF